MKLQIKYKSNLNIMFYIMLVTTMIGYLGYYITSKNNNQNIYFLYSNFQIYNVPLWGDILRFAKDILISLIGLMLILHISTKKQLKGLLAIIIMLVIATANMFLHDGVAMYIITGTRTYLYFIVLFLMTFYLKPKQISSKIILRIILFGLIVNLIVGIEQGIRGTFGDITLIGQGGYRFCALYGGVNGISGLAIASSLFILIFDNKMKLKKSISLLVFAMCMAISLIGGARSAIINIGILFVLWFVNKMKMNVSSKTLMMIIASILIVPLVINFSMSIADRGSILQVQLESGRLAILESLLTESSVFDLIFGRGIGFGGNADTIYKQANDSTNYIILDGTFNLIIFQFGLIGLAATFYIIYILYKKTIKNTNIIERAGFFGTLILQCFTGNITEIFSFIVILVICYWVMYRPEVFDLDIKDQKHR